MGKTFADIAQLIAERVIRPNPVVSGQIVADLGTVNSTPQVTVRVGDARRQAVYLAPHAITPTGNVFVCRLGPELTAPLVVVATNYQVIGGSSGTATGTGSTLGVGATSAAAATDWAAGMADPTSAEYGERGAALPLVLGRVADGV